MSSMNDRREDRGSPLRRGKLAVAALALSLGMTGCATGAYPLDIFPEMHYQQSFRSQEGPRVEAPTDSVPRQGKPLPVDLGTAATIRSTVASTDATLAQGKALFARNCAPCHGPEGKGDGPLVRYFENGKDNRSQDGKGLVPIDLTSARGRIWMAGQSGGMYSIISNGQGQWMPPFKNLLTEDERWLIIQAVKKLQDDNPLRPAAQ